MDALTILVKREGKTIKNLRSDINKRVGNALKTMNDLMEEFHNETINNTDTNRMRFLFLQHLAVDHMVT
jgi:hypothetical protein